MLGEDPYLSIVVRGPAATALALSLSLGRLCPVPARRLSVVIKSLSQGAFVMSTIGIPIAVSFLTALTLGQPIAITAVDQNGAPVDPGPLSFSSDNSSVIVTTDPSASNSFLLNGVQGSPVTANVTFTDATGDTVVVTATTTDPVVTPTVTLVATAGAAV